jgi:hypothetical protein
MKKCFSIYSKNKCIYNIDMNYHIDKNFYIKYDDVKITKLYNNIYFKENPTNIDKLYKYEMNKLEKAFTIERFKEIKPEEFVCRI